MRSTVAVSIFALFASLLAAPTPQTAALSGLIGSLTSTTGSATNPSVGSNNLITGNGNKNGQDNGNAFNLRPLGSILGNSKRGLLDSVEGVQVAGPIASGLTDGEGGLLNGVNVGLTTGSLTNSIPALNGLVGRGLTDNLDLSKLNQGQLISLLGQVTGALQNNGANSGATGTLSPVTGALQNNGATSGVTGALTPVTGATKPVIDATKPVTGATGGLTSGLLKRQSNLLSGVTGTVSGVVDTLSTTSGSVTGAAAGSGNRLLNNSNSNGQGNGNNN